MFRTHNRHNKKEQDSSCSYIQRGTKGQKEIECPHPTPRLVKNTRYGWDSRTRTCKARVKVSCVAVTPYPIGIMRTSGQGHFRPLFRYYNTKRLSCQYSGFADGGVRESFCVCANRRHRFCRACGGAMHARAWVCGMHAIHAIPWRCAERCARYCGDVRRKQCAARRRRCGAGTLSHSGGRRCGAGLAHADCTRVWGVRWRMRGVREHGVRRICASVRSDALRDFPCIRMCPRFSGAAFG